MPLAAPAPAAPASAIFVRFLFYPEQKHNSTDTTLGVRLPATCVVLRDCYIRAIIWQNTLCFSD
jgi:hypothetical protein